jgi:hypothetical protein
MAINANDVAKDMLAYTMAKDKQSLKNLLSRNGIELPAQASDKDVIMATLLASSRSTFFKSELSNLLKSNVTTAQNDFMPFVGGQFEIGTETDKMMFTGSDDFFNVGGYVSPTFGSGVTAAAKQASTQNTPTKRQQRQEKRTTRKASRVTTSQGDEEKPKGRVWDWVKGNVLTQDNVNAAIQVGINALNNRTARRSNEINYETDDILRRQAEIDRMALGRRTPTTNVTTIALVVLGVIVLGGVVYYMSKK